MVVQTLIKWYIIRQRFFFISTFTILQKCTLESKVLAFCTAYDKFHESLGSNCFSRLEGQCPYFKETYNYLWFSRGFGPLPPPSGPTYDKTVHRLWPATMQINSMQTVLLYGFTVYMGLLLYKHWINLLCLCLTGNKLIRKSVTHQKL